MEDIIITRVTQPLKRDLRHTVAGLLAEAFASDTAMIDMIGESRWQNIRKTYFNVQLSHPDQFLLAWQGETLVAVLIATTPDAHFSFTAAVHQLIVMKRLLRQHYGDSQRIADRINQQVPTGRHTYINQLAVRPSHHGSGIGSRLLDELKSDSSEIPLFVDCHQDLVAFYVRSGFVKTADIGMSGLVVMANGTY
jgi:ribosomal protein S18 acetylase RimI-like enzyme